MRPLTSSLARAFIVVAAVMSFGPAIPAEGAHILLKNSWVRTYKNRVTITSNCRLEKSHQHPNGISDDGKDGDLHMACRSTAIGLPMVAEIVNAAGFPDAVDAAKTGANARETRRLTGAWRLWLEHPSSGTQTQGGAVPVPTNTNPDHVFEIHPLTRLGSEDLSDSFVDIDGYSPYEARQAFRDYEGRVFKVSRSGGYTSIEGVKARYNYAGFRFTLAGKPWKVADGYIAAATIDGVVSEPRRMVFVEGTPPAGLIAGARKGDRFEALGIPRIDLDKIDAAIAAGEDQVPAAYEMIIVGLERR